MSIGCRKHPIFVKMLQQMRLRGPIALTPTRFLADQPLADQPLADQRLADQRLTDSFSRRPAPTPSKIFFGFRKPATMPKWLPSQKLIKF